MLRREIFQRSRDEDDRGAVLYVLILFLVLFMAVATVAVDLAALGARGQDLQNTSDAAALAGVVEYQQQLVNGSSPDDARLAALQTIYAIMRQNGIDPDSPDIRVDLEISDDRSELKVTIGDNSPNQFLPNDLLGETLKDDQTGVEREATATFVACEFECSLSVAIPSPVTTINAIGKGDGYKPIKVGNRLYAMNHNTRAQSIVCVDTSSQGPCWSGSVERVAYAPGVGYNDRNPEMPHTAVIGDRIYWTATDESNGLRLFCFQTAVDAEFDAPCQDAVDLDRSLLRFDEGDADNTLTNDKDENRGGGTFTVFGEKVFAFSDNHRIHCHNPATGQVCNDYANGGNPTGLAAFPPNSPADGNHGSSIDRVIDEDTGFVYATLHIPFVGERVVLRNVETDRFLTRTGGIAIATDDGATDDSWWDIESNGLETISIQSARTGGFLESSDFNFGATTGGNGTDERFRWKATVDQVTPPNPGYRLLAPSNDPVSEPGLTDDLGDDTIDRVDPAVFLDTYWEFYPWQCGDTANPPANSSPANYTPGTWLHCYDTGVVSGTPQPCPDFSVRNAAGTSSPLHPDGTRFSGRLWFYYGAGPDPLRQGVCSSGYGTAEDPGVRPRSAQSIEINCVNLDGTYNSTMVAAMVPLRNEIRSRTGGWPGAWGDPHYNVAENRLFYPTEHNTPRAICFDFDSGSCGSQTRTVTYTPQPTASNPNPAPRTVDTEDYGYVSVDDCVFALGHNAFFWAFKSSDPESTCDPRPVTTQVSKCPCGGPDGAGRWGELDFREVDFTPFDYFGVRILTDAGVNSVPIFPADGSFISMKPADAVRQIPLDDLAIPEGALTISVEISVQGVSDDALANVGEFDIRFAQRPRLID